MASPSLPFDYSSYFSPMANTAAPWNNVSYGANNYNPNDFYKQFLNEASGQAQYAGALENYYRAPMNAMAGSIAAQPGFSDQELQNMLQTGQYQSGITTPDQYATLAPTGSEAAGLGTDIFQYYNPQAINDLYQGAAAGEGDQFHGATDIYNAAGSAMGDTLTNQRKGYASAIDPNALQLDPNGNYLNALEGAYNQHAGAINAATNNSNLQLQLKPGDYLMGNQEVQDIQNQAGQAVQTARQAQFEQLQRAAAASGNADPLAVAALGRETQQRANESAANAETNAYLQATGQQRQLAMNYAGANLGASQTQAGLQTAAQENLLGQQLGAASQYQAQRLGAQQNLTADQMAAVGAQTQAGLNAAQYGGSTGIGLAEQGMAMNAGIGQMGIGAQQYLQNSGTALSQQQIQNTMQQYQQRLQNAMYQQQNTFNQNTGITDRQAAAYQAAANARINGQNTFLNWSTGQTGQAVGQQQTAMQQQLQAGQGWGGYANQKATIPTGFDKALGAIAGAAGGFFGGL